MATMVPMLLEAIRVALVAGMQTPFNPTTDITYADVIKVGRYQKDPVGKNITLSIQPGDPEKAEWVDGIVTLESMNNIGFKIDPREVGGGECWWRRGIVGIECYFIREKQDEDQALTAAYTVLGRLQHTLENMNVGGLTDEYGECAVKLFPYSYTFVESGGPPKSYLWRGKLYWEVLTEIP